MNRHGELDLAALNAGILGLTPHYCGVKAESASVCLHSQGHGQAVPISVDNKGVTEERVVKRLDVTPVMTSTYQDENLATGDGACGIALLLARDIYATKKVTTTRTGTGIDYWLDDGLDPVNILGASQRLEISGIRSGNSDAVSRRVIQKAKQTAQSRASGVHAVVVIVEFSQPMAVVHEVAA